MDILSNFAESISDLIFDQKQKQTEKKKEQERMIEKEQEPEVVVPTEIFLEKRISFSSISHLKRTSIPQPRGSRARTFVRFLKIE